MYFLFYFKLIIIITYKFITFLTYKSIDFKKTLKLINDYIVISLCEIINLNKSDLSNYINFV